MVRRWARTSARRPHAGVQNLLNICLVPARTVGLGIDERSWFGRRAKTLPSAGGVPENALGCSILWRNATSR
jgi:hypothetical protein